MNEQDTQNRTDYRSLSDAERVTMRNNLRAFMEEHPARAPFGVRLLGVFDSFWENRSRRALYLRPIAAGLVLILFVGAGTSYAAESSLPGDPLYAVKININEPIQGAFATSPEAKAQWNTTLLDRRLTEAETLAAQNKLTPQTSVELQSQINSSAQNFNVNVVALSSASNTPALATVQSDLEASLAGHAQILSALAPSIAPRARALLTPILASVDERVVQVNEQRKWSDEHVAADASSSALRIAAATGQDASQVVSQMSALAPQAQTLGASSSAEVDAGAAQARSSLSDGQEHLRRGQYSQAFRAFQNAIQAVQQTETSVDAAVNLKATSGITIDVATSADMSAVSAASSTDATSTSE